jgi:hypothetical protein
MSRPSLEDATVLVAACLYDDGNKFSQMVNESRLREGEMIRPDGREISFAEDEEKISLEEAVKHSVISLEPKEVEVSRGVSDKNALHRNDRLQLTESGLRRANFVCQLQSVGDSGIVGRVQWPDPNKTPQHDERLKRTVRSIGDKFPSGNPVSEQEADARWVQHLGASKAGVPNHIFVRRSPRPPENTPGGNEPSPAPRGPSLGQSPTPEGQSPSGPSTRWPGIDL